MFFCVFLFGFFGLILGWGVGFGLFWFLWCFFKGFLGFSGFSVFTWWLAAFGGLVIL